MLGFKRRGNKIRPLLDVNAIWKSGSSTYPEMIRILMEDGRVIRYTMDRKPVNIHTGVNGWKETGWQIVGYLYRDKEKPLKRL